MEANLKPLNDGQLTATVRDSTRQIWLAGLGAYAMTEKEGGKVFSTLVAEGEALEARLRKVAEDQAERVKVKVTDARNKLEQVFEERVSKALQALSVPTDADIQELARKIEELAATVEALKALQREATEQTGKAAA